MQEDLTRVDLMLGQSPLFPETVAIDLDGEVWDEVFDTNFKVPSCLIAAPAPSPADYSCCVTSPVFNTASLISYLESGGDYSRLFALIPYVARAWALRFKQIVFTN